jgi:hypothetical protein
MNMRNLTVFLLVFALSAVASADTIGGTYITDVDRSAGQSGDRPLIGLFDGETDPMAMYAGNLTDGNPVFSDRPYTHKDVPAWMEGYEYVMTFNTDKASSEFDVSYLVTLGEEAPLWIAVDDRLAGDGFGDLLSWVEMITYRFPCGIEWADTDDNLTVNGDDDRQMSVFMTTTNLPAGTYDFAMNPLGRNFYTMGTVPEPMTIALLGFGGLALIRRKR